MNDVIQKTKALIDTFEKSSLIEKLEHYKSKVLMNSKLMDLITKYNKSEVQYEKISLKKEIYENEDYRNYMKYYNELFYYVLKINKKFNDYTDIRSCKS